jgi:hypothetical protein
MSVNDKDTAKALCGQWMPRKKTTCARMPGHAGPCMTAENMALRKAYRRNHPHPESPESRKKSNRKYRISSYGLSQEQFDRLLAAQQHTGYIERRYAMARAYLESPPVQLLAPSARTISAPPTGDGTSPRPRRTPTARTPGCGSRRTRQRPAQGTRNRKMKGAR